MRPTSRRRWRRRRRSWRGGGRKLAALLRRRHAARRRRGGRWRPSSTSSGCRARRSRRSSTASRWISAPPLRDVRRICTGTCIRVASAVGLICLEIFGYRDPGARQYAIDLGVALQLTNILRDVPEDLGAAGSTFRKRICARTASPRTICSRKRTRRRAASVAGGEGAAAAAGARAPATTTRAPRATAARRRAPARRRRDHGRDLPRDPRSHRAARLRRLLVRRPHPAAAARAHCRDDLGGVAAETMTAACRRTSSSSAPASPG